MWSALTHAFDFLNFPGGLTQSDWFGLITGTVSTGYGITAYNQAAYTSNVGMKQAQLYQEKNYLLSWVSIARDDIREMMSISVNRIDNYNLVATLILATAADALLGVTFDANAPNFVVHAFWASIGLSIAYFALSIMFGIKGQNSAFTNTMRLLTWELRPENPAKYTYDYMKQAQQFERDGLREMFRLPGLWPNYQKRPKSQECSEDHSEDSPRKQSDSGMPTCDEEEGGHVLEDIIPETRRLMYMKRFANFMQLWLPLEWFSRYCIGLGLISLAQGASYFCLGSFYDDNRTYRGVIMTSLVVIFIFVTLTILRHNTRGRTMSIRIFVACMFVWGPATATLCLVVLPTDIAKYVGPLSNFGHFFLYSCVLLVSFVEKKSPQRTAEKFCRGPHGQTFKQREYPLGERQKTQRLRKAPTANWTLAHRQHSEETTQETDDAVLRDSTNYTDDEPWFTDPGMPDAPTKSDLQSENQSALTSLEDTLFTVRALVALSAMVWFALFIASALEVLEVSSPAFLEGSEHLLEVTQVRFSWPVEANGPHGLACAGSIVFIANRYKVFQIQDASSKPERCKVDGVIADLSLSCEREGICQPLLLLNGSSPQVTNCIGKKFPLLQEPVALEKFAVRRNSKADVPLNSTLLGSHGKTMITFDWDQQLLGWSPLWERSLERDIVGLDLIDDRLFTFHREKDRITGTQTDVVETWLLDLPASKTRWRFHPAGYSPSDERLVAGCAIDRKTVMLLTSNAKLYRGHL